MATFVGGMFRRVQAALGVGSTPTATAVAPPPPERGRNPVREDLERRRARYLVEQRAAHAEQAAQERARREGEADRQRQAQEDILEAIARSPVGIYWPGDAGAVPLDRLGGFRRRHPFVAGVLDIVGGGGA